MRFNFGKNWQSFTQSALNKDAIEQGRNDFRRLLSKVDLKSKRFLDLGFGQGLALCFAAELGAFCKGIDIDPDNLQAFTKTLSFFNLQNEPDVEVGSILDWNLVEEFIRQGAFDIVHSWGVLHHTGDMAMAIKHAASITSEQGFLVLAIYNTHWSSPLWTAIKWLYNISPGFIKRSIVAVNYWVIYLAKYLVTGKDPRKKQRGMDFYHDVVDWVGGYPYEHAHPGEVVAMVGPDFELIDFIAATVPTGCNQFVFKRTHA